MSSGTIVVIGLASFGMCGLGILACLVAHWRVVRSAPEPGSEQPVVLVVLGYPVRRSGVPHPMQRWRVSLACRSVDRYRVVRVVFTGAATRGERSEASVMADLFRQANPSLELDLVEEEQALTTWENVNFSRALVAQEESVVVISDPLHAARAVRYWTKQDGSLPQRAFICDCTSFADGWQFKPRAAVFELLRFAKRRALSQD